MAERDASYRVRSRSREREREPRDRDPEDEGTKLYIGNLSFGTSSDELRDAFSEFGRVNDAQVIEDRETGRSRGFGFVTFATREEAEAAIDKMNGSELSGRNITVNKARKRGEGGPRRDFNGGGGRGGGGYSRGGGGGYNKGGYDREERGGGGFRDRGGDRDRDRGYDGRGSRDY